MNAFFQTRITLQHDRTSFSSQKPPETSNPFNDFQRNDTSFASTVLPVNPLAILNPEPPERLWTLAEYLKKEEKSIYKHEFLNGKIIALPRARTPHNAIAANLITAMNNAIDKAGKNYIVLGSDQLVYLPKLNFGLYPDALVVCEQLEHFDKNQVLLINPIFWLTC